MSDNPIEDVHKVIEKTRKINEEYNHLTVICEEQAIEDAKHLEAARDTGKNLPLDGVAVTVKDAICVKGVQSTAGSRILRGYKPAFDSTVVKRIRQAGGIIIGKSSQDEFGFGSFSTNTDTVPKNPWDKNRSCGGSSGGAAGFTAAADFDHIAIGESTGGSITNPSMFCGVYGLCPTYGRVSRNGLIPYANSLDKIGPIARSAKECGLMLEIISGRDENDLTTVDFEESSGEVRKVGVLNFNVSEEVAKGMERVRLAYSRRYELIDIDLPVTKKYAMHAYYIMAMAEASTNLARLCGMRYGIQPEPGTSYNDLFKTARREFHEETKKRIMMGTYARMAGLRDKFYLKAAKVRTLVINEYKEAFRKVDCILSPTTPFIAPTFDEIEKLTPIQKYTCDVMTTGPNLAGIPHMHIPVKLKHPVGFTIMADHFNEKILLNMAGVKI